MVRVLRTVACLARLRILSRLASANERAPTALAGELGISVDLLCTHLRSLSLAGLIQRRPSGRWCYYRAESPYSDEAFSGKIMSWLRTWLRDPARLTKNAAPEDARNASPEELEAQLHTIMFEAATAFTHLRRLRILRRLVEKGPADGLTFIREMQMSGPAVTRQMGKLKRRGYVSACRIGPRMTYALAARFKTRIHAELFRIVREEWQKQECRS